MVITAWIIAIVVFILSLISVWGTFFLLLLFIGGLMVLGNYTGLDLLSTLEGDDINMFGGALFGPWMLVGALTIIGQIVGFAEDVGKAVKNLADDDRRR